MPVKTEFSCIFQNISFCPFPERSKRRIFCNIYLENLVELLEVKLTELWGSPCDWVSLEFLTSRIVYTEPLAITVKVFLSWHSFPWQCLLLSLCFVNLCLHLLACLTLQSSVKQFAMCLSIAYGSKKNCWFFSLLRSLLAVRIEWWLPSYLHTEPKPRYDFFSKRN